MTPRKPTWDWKARGSAEFQHFTVAFAIKEYVQNVVGQVLKDLKLREWSDWEREDLRELPLKEREQRKQTLTAAYPSLLTAPHGASLKRTKAWVPSYILSAIIPQSRLRRTPMTMSDLRIALVVWQHLSVELCALSFCNNHLDPRAKFTSFTVDGASTSRSNEWAVGEKGKGFILATQFLFEHIEQHIARLHDDGHEIPKDVKEGVSFRVGHQIGTLRWKKSRSGEDDLLQVVLDDLTPYTVEEYMNKLTTDARHKNQTSSDEDEVEPDDVAESPQLLKKAEAALRGVYSRRVTQQLDSKGEPAVLHNDGRCLVFPDEVSMTVIGLEGTFQPEYLFSAIYGIIPPPQAWRVDGSPVQFFIAAMDTLDAHAQESTDPKFYHRDQYVPYGPHLNRVSFNYHGELNITSDRVAIIRDRKLFGAYKLALSESADRAFRTFPELALELALDILSDDHSESLASLVLPSNKLGAGAYRAAFEAAMREMHPDIAADVSIYPMVIHPVAALVDDESEELFQQFGLTPIKVSSKAWEIMEKSGAYMTIEDYARQVLLSSPVLTDSDKRKKSSPVVTDSEKRKKSKSHRQPQDASDDPPNIPERTVPNAASKKANNGKGLERLRVALSHLAPAVPAANITMRNYSKRIPSVVWDKDNNVFAFALPPKCEEHPTDTCFCWVGPFLHDAARDYEGGTLNKMKLFRAYLSCMIDDIAVNDGQDVKTPDVMDIDDHPRIDNCHSTPRRVVSRSRTPSRSVFQSVLKSAGLIHSTPSQASNTPVGHTIDSGSRAPHVSSPAAADGPPVRGAGEPIPSAEPDDEDTALATLGKVVASYKEQKVALAEASSKLKHRTDELRRAGEMKDARVVLLQDKMKALQEELKTADAAAKAFGEMKDATIALLKAQVKELQEELKTADAAAEAFVRSRKKPRVA